MVRAGRWCGGAGVVVGHGAGGWAVCSGAGGSVRSGPGAAGGGGAGTHLTRARWCMLLCGACSVRRGDASRGRRRRRGGQNCGSVIGDGSNLSCGAEAAAKRTTVQQASSKHRPAGKLEAPSNRQARSSVQQASSVTAPPHLKAPSSLLPRPAASGVSGRSGYFRNFSRVTNPPQTTTPGLRTTVPLLSGLQARPRERLGGSRFRQR